jgi:hypothetical protein
MPPAHTEHPNIDTPIPIPHAQVTTQPSLVARMVEALSLAGDERVLEIGTGYGWQTALLARRGPRSPTTARSTNNLANGDCLCGSRREFRGHAVAGRRSKAAGSRVRRPRAGCQTPAAVPSARR